MSKMSFRRIVKTDAPTAQEGAPLPAQGAVPAETADTTSNFRQAVMEMFSTSEEFSPGPSGLSEQPGPFALSGSSGLPGTPSAPSAPAPSPEQPVAAAPQRPAQENELPAATYISPTTRVGGSLCVEGDAEIYGHVEGHVECSRSLFLQGTVDGGLSAQNAELVDASVTGDILAADSLVTGGESMIKGSISARSIDFYGRLKGDITAEELLIIRKDSVVVGDVSSPSLSIELGAAVQGQVNVTSRLIETVECLGTPDISDGEPSE